MGDCVVPNSTIGDDMYLDRIGNRTIILMIVLLFAALVVELLLW